jgi:hypothetical protein
MTSSRMLGESPLRKKPMVSSLPTVYPAYCTRSLKSEMYWSMSGKHILHWSSSGLALCWDCKSTKWSLNSWMKVVHTSCMSSLTGSRELTHAPMSLIHTAVCCPWNRVSAMDTLQIGEFSPGTCKFTQK